MTFKIHKHEDQYYLSSSRSNQLKHVVKPNAVAYVAGRYKNGFTRSVITADVFPMTHAIITTIWNKTK